MPKKNGRDQTRKGKPNKQNKNLQGVLNLESWMPDRPVMELIEMLSALDKQGYVKAIVETPKGSRNKYKYDPQSGLFECSAALQAGMTFPFEFGFVPSTRAADGDPIDVIVLMDEPSFAGCLVHVRIIGVLEAEQTENGNSFRNDRLIGVHLKSVDYGNLNHWQELEANVRKEIEEFFVNYNRCKGRLFKPLAWRGPKRAYKLLNQSIEFKKQKSA